MPPQTFTFDLPGATIAEVYILPGQAVKKGDLLAKIDETDLLTALEKAEANLALIEAQIAHEEAPPLPGDLTEAEARLASAQAELDYLLSLPGAEAITQAAADLRLREVELRRAQEAYDAVAYSQSIGMSPQAAELQTATLNYERAQAIYDEATKPASADKIAAARLTVAQAQNALDKLRTGLRPEAKLVNQAKRQEAEIQVAEARTNLTQAKLYAPWDGQVTEVNAAPGLSAANASVKIARAGSLRFVTTNFSERNLADIKPGDEATIHLKTYPDVPMPAVVYRIELQASAKDGDTALFTVHFDFNSGDFEVRPGMTGRVEIALEPAQ
jgi:HlyD family secretion protein